MRRLTPTQRAALEVCADTPAGVPTGNRTHYTGRTVHAGTAALLARDQLVTITYAHPHRPHDHDLVTITDKGRAALATGHYPNRKN